MDSSTRPIPRLRLWLAIAAAVGTGAAGITSAIVRGAFAEQLPGAVLALVLYSTLGFLILRGHQWARWVLFAFMALTALTCFLFAFLSPDVKGRLFLAAAFYVLITIMIAIPARRLPR